MKDEMFIKSLHSLTELQPYFLGLRVKLSIDLPLILGNAIVDHAYPVFLGMHAFDMLAKP